MQVGTFTATAQQRRHIFRLERDFKILTIERTSTISMAGQLRTGCPERISSVITDHASNRTDNVNRVELGAMAFFKQLGEGALVEKYDKLTGIYTANITLIFTGDKGMHVTSDDAFNLEIDDAFVGATYELHLFESAYYGNKYFEYTSVTNLSGSKRKPLDVDNLVGVIIPTNSNIDRIILRYANGANAETSVEQLRHDNSLMNDLECRQITFDADTIGSARKTDNFGSEESEYVYLDCENITHIDLDSDGSVFEITQVGIRAR